MADNNAVRRKSSKMKVVEVPSVDSYGHKQPQNLEMECAVLGALMVDGDAYSQVSELLRPESFYDHRHQVIYQAVQSLSAEQKPLDFMTIIDKLESLGTIEEAGGPAYIMQINSQISSSAHLEYHAKIVAQKFLARQLITFSSWLLTSAFDTTIDVADMMQEAEGQLFKISQTNLKKEYTQINPVIGQVYDNLRLNAARENGLSGITTGFDRLDKMTNGWQKSDLIIIAARPAMGKTAFVISMVRRMAVDYGIPVAIFSLEMSNQQLVQRLMVNVCEISGEKMRSGQLAPYEWGQLDAKVRLLIDKPIYVDDTPQLSIFELRTKARRLVREHDVKCIMIDYLQLMNASGMNVNSRQEEVAVISRSLKGLAKELNIPIIALSQLNRGVEGREGYEGKRPLLSDLRESGSIEQDADIVCFIHRPEYYGFKQDDKGNDVRGRAEFIIAKHRNGQIGDVLLQFKSEFARFSDVDERAPMPGETVDQMGGTFTSPPPSAEELSEQESYASNMPASDPFASLGAPDRPPF
ncbi:MAG: replicative DNA helicase [Bacteroidaceae bacterium]|nr:replicative DNA helicase [Bacteroidaceae bacterium]